MDFFTHSIFRPSRPEFRLQPESGWHPSGGRGGTSALAGQCWGSLLPGRRSHAMLADGFPDQTQLAGDAVASTGTGDGRLDDASLEDWKLRQGWPYWKSLRYIVGQFWTLILLCAVASFWVQSAPIRNHVRPFDFHGCFGATYPEVERCLAGSSTKGGLSLPETAAAVL